MAILHIVPVLVALMLTLVMIAVAHEGEPHNHENEADDDDGEKVVVETILPAPDDCVRKSKIHDQLSMHYVGMLTETGTKFDSSHDRNQPFTFQLGAGQVIKGWDQGLLEMCVGEKRRLIIPASKGYGKAGAGELIPPNAGLTFEVELVSIDDGQRPPNVFKEIDLDADLQLSQDEVSNYLKKQAPNHVDKPEDTDQQTEIIKQIFDQEDKDRNGYISYDEFSGPKHDEL